jgi:hypothetical protein
MASKFSRRQLFVGAVASAAAVLTGCQGSTGVSSRGLQPAGNGSMSRSETIVGARPIMVDGIALKPVAQMPPPPPIVANSIIGNRTEISPGVFQFSGTVSYVNTKYVARGAAKWLRLENGGVTFWVGKGQHLAMWEQKPGANEVSIITIDPSVPDR